MSFLRRLLGRGAKDRFHVTDPAILDRFLRKPDFPWLISFPRTGSHFLRMIMELYFGRPGLRRVFFYPEVTDYTCYHWHDTDLATKGVKSVIYLYRDPVETVYSQIRYHKEDPRDAERVRHWASVYGRHLSKWLFDESFTTRKTVVRYEALRRDPVEEFAKVCAHLGETLDPQRLARAISQISKEDLKKRTADDQQVVDLSPEYALERERFRQTFGALVEQIVFDGRPRLRELFAKPRGADA